MIVTALKSTALGVVASEVQVKVPPPLSTMPLPLSVPSLTPVKTISVRDSLGSVVLIVISTGVSSFVLTEEGILTSIKGST